MEKPSFIFSSGPIELKEEGENFFVEGHISTSDLDLVNDIVTKDCIMDMAEQMRERTIKLDIEHESFKGQTDLEMEINKTIIPAAKIEDFLVDKKGLKIRGMLNKHIGRFNEVKNSIKDGFLDAFSIAFMPVKSRTEIREGSEIRLLDKINLLNVAFTGNPVNTQTTMTKVFAKSLEFLKESESHNHSSNDIIKSQEVKNMGEDNKDEEKKEESQSESEEKKEEGQSSEESSESEEKAKKKPDEDEDEEEKKKKKFSKKDDESEEKEEDDESGDESKEESKEESSTDEEVKNLKKEMAEVKAALKRPMLKSKIESEDKSKQFEEKSLNPLDLVS